MVTRTPRRTHRQAAEALRFSSDILSHVAEGVVIVRISDGVIVFTNPRFEQVFGYSSGELVGKHVSIVNAATDKSPEETAREIAEALHADGRWEGEVYNRRKDGTPFWCHASVSTFAHAEFGTVWIGVSRDITERKRLQEQLLRTKVFLDSIVENIPNIVFVKDAKSLEYVLFNRAGAEVFSHRRDNLIGKNDYDLFPKAQADFFTEKDRAVLRNKTLLDIPEEPIKTANDGERIVHTKKIPILDDQGEPVYLLGISEDITERRHAEQMQRRHERETTIVNGILRAINAHFDVKAAFPEVCAGLRELAGCSAVGLGLFDESREWVSLVTSDVPWAVSASQDVRLRSTEIPGAEDILAGKPIVVRDLTPELHYPIVQLTYDTLGARSFVSLPLCAGSNVVGYLNLLWGEVDGCESGEMGTLSQIANAVAIAVEKSRLFEEVSVGRERLAALSQRLIEVQEGERQHLARELHDEVGQVLTGLKLTLGAIDRLPPPAGQARLRDARQHLDELFARVRDLSLDLRPAMLDDLGLLAALVWLVNRYSHQANIQMHIEHDGVNRRFAPQIETGAYRIVQEALTNVARHAGVTEATVRLWADDRTLTIQIIDSGKGFDPALAAVDSARGGVLGMCERARLLGGDVTVESTPGEGTRVIAQLPV